MPLFWCLEWAVIFVSLSLFVPPPPPPPPPPPALQFTPLCFHFCTTYHLVGLVAQALASRAEDPGFESRLWRDVSGVESNDFKIGTPVATLPGVIGSVLGLVGPVSVHCDWVRWKVWPATSISVWQHVKLSEQVRPWDTLACCWDVKQPTNQPTLPPPLPSR